MDLIITILAFLLLIGVVITVHEGGHYLMARVSNIKILEFSIGFGKIIFSKQLGKDKTLFTLRLLPLGGFVKPLDKTAIPVEQWNNLSEEEKSRSLANASRSKKALMVAGGPGFNFILAIILYIFISTFIGVSPNPAKISQLTADSLFLKAGISEGETITVINNKNIKNMNEAFSSLANLAIKGQKTTIQTDKGIYAIDFAKLDLSKMQDNITHLMGIYFVSAQGDIIIKNVNTDSPAQNANLQENDIIKKANKIEINELGKFIRIINASPNKIVELEVLREANIMNIQVIPEAKKQGNLIVGKVGASFKVINSPVVATEKYSFIDSISYSTHKVFDGAYTTAISLIKLVTGDISMKSISGPIAIADYSGKSAQIGLYSYLSLMAAISIAIGVFNLMPIPMLDGGLLIQYTIEALRGKDLSQAVLSKLQFIGVTIIGSMFFIAIFNDIIKYVIL